MSSQESYKKELLERLHEFNNEDFQTLYKLLEYDYRLMPFHCKAQYIDSIYTFKDKVFINRLIKTITENEIKSWNVTPDFILSVLEGREKIYKVVELEEYIKLVKNQK